MGNGTRQLQIRIGDVTERMRRGHNPFLHLCREWVAPYNRGVVGRIIRGGRKPDPTHTSLGRIAGPLVAGVGWHHFTQPCRARVEVCRKDSEIFQVIQGGLTQADSVTSPRLKVMLELGEKATAARDALTHAAKLPKEFLYIPERTPFAAPECC